MFQRDKRGRLKLSLVVILSMVFLAQGQQTFRMLVLYTPAASAAMGASNVRNYITAWSANEMNNIYYNSRDAGNPAVYNVQIAGIDSVTYTESGNMGSDNLAVLAGTGAFSKVSTLQAQYSADVVLLVTNYTGYSGVTITTIPPIYGTSHYCVSVVQYNYMQQRFTAAHEVGHIFGCEHALWDDTSYATQHAPWLFAHGWGDRPTLQNPYGTWGTVMCYNNGRVEVFSNPNVVVNIGGNNYYCGQTDTAYNAHVYTQNVAGVNGFQSTPATLQIQNDTLCNQEYADVRATGSISFASGSEFTVQQGGQLNLSTGSGLAKRSAGHGGGGPQVGPPKSAPSVTAFSIRSSRTALVVSYVLAKDAEVSFRLFDFQGKLIMQKNLGSKSAGHYSERLRTNFYHSGQMYIVTMKAGNMVFKQVMRFGE